MERIVLSVVMVVEGILRAPDSEAHFDTGWGLYHACAPNTRLYLLSHTWAAPDIQPWLAKRHLTRHLQYLHQPDPGPAGRLEALDRLRSWRVSLVIEPDPECAAAEINAGWNTALVTHPQYTQARWRPDYPGRIRPWDQLTHAIERQTELRLADPRHQESAP
ncbi:hypothetical protein ABZ543_12690 [Streptomyces roseifaciens]